MILINKWDQNKPSFSKPSSFSSGFIALISVMMLAFGCISLLAISIFSVATYADSVYSHELRIQARLDMKSCLNTIALMMSRNYFLQGNISLQEFGCEVSVVNDSENGVVGDVTVNASLQLGEIRMSGEEIIRLQDYNVAIVSFTTSD